MVELQRNLFLEKIILQLELVSGSDMNQATQRARAMVMKYGMSEEMGPVEYGENQEEVFLGRSVSRQQNQCQRKLLKKLIKK